MSTEIPQGWLNHMPYGTVIEGTKILPFKVPLRKELTRNLPAQECFTPELLMEKFPKLKCIIDLTNTFRYYSPQVFWKAGVKYLKIMIPGREVPRRQHVEKFIKALSDFNLSTESDELIGVHCTHGINRTGYLICQYIMQDLGWTPEQSLIAFAKARGYDIERRAYVDAVLKAPSTVPTYRPEDRYGVLVNRDRQEHSTFQASNYTRRARLHHGTSGMATPYRYSRRRRSGERSRPYPNFRVDSFDDNRPR